MICVMMKLIEKAFSLRQHQSLSSFLRAPFSCSQVGVIHTRSRRSPQRGGSLPLLHLWQWTTGRLPGGSPWTPAPAGTNPAGVAESLGLDGAASTSLVGAHLSINIQQKAVARESDNVNAISSILNIWLICAKWQVGEFPSAKFMKWAFFVAPGPKPMETWGGEEVSMGNSWDQEEEVEIGMWSNSQQDNRSHDQNTWNYKHKGSYKVCSPVAWNICVLQI